MRLACRTSKSRLCSAWVASDETLPRAVWARKYAWFADVIHEYFLARLLSGESNGIRGLDFF